MSFQGFTPLDFQTFTINGLEPRMEAIRERIQPKFKSIGDTLLDDVSILAGSEMHLHIAQHLRRKTNAPKDTWMAFSSNKRGYKQHPHFQVGLFDDHLFIWFALIYELPHKQAIATTYLQQLQQVIDIIPQDYVISLDHTKKDSLIAGNLSATDWEHMLVKFRDVKKTELLVGRHFQANDSLLADGEAFIHVVKETITELMPLYRLASL
jgi:uncharacterized protein YktB (UPF0637 family)